VGSQQLISRYSDNGTACYRIPNVLSLAPAPNRGDSSSVSAAQPVLLVFAEARRNSCSDSGPKSLAMRRSEDGGRTWEPTQFLVTDPPSAKDGLNLGASVWDYETETVFVHYGVCGHACAPNGSTYVLASKVIIMSVGVSATGWSHVQ
jgi:hypothetical protein